MQERPQPSEKQPPKRKSTAKKKKNLLVLYLLLGVIAILLVIVAAILPREPSPPVRLPEMNYDTQSAPDNSPSSAQPLVGKSSQRVTRSPERTPSTPEPVAYRRPQAHGKLIFVIDDVGNSVEELRPFLKVPGALTLSIMPQRPHTLDSYHLIMKAGKVPILHQPMQADGPDNPGAGAIYTTMSQKQVDETLKRNLEGMGAIAWVNNHEGSRATSNIDTMTYVLGYLKSRNIHFLDSRTSVDTKVREAALRLGLPYYMRNSYFLDNTISRADILKEIDSGLKVAQKEGYAVMIGHVWDKDLANILSEVYPQLTAEGYTITDIRSLLMEPTANVRTGN